MEVQNVSSGLAMTASISSGAMGWLLTVGIFIAVLVTLFILSKNFRHFLYGTVVTTICYVNYTLSRWIGVETTQTNYGPIKVLGYIVGFILVSIGAGKILMKFKFMKKIDDNLTSVKDTDTTGEKNEI